MSGPSIEVPRLETAPEKRLDSWKEIAAYLNRDVTTVQRWEKREGMPVYRHVHDKRGSVYAVPEELDVWRGQRRPREEQQEVAESGEDLRVRPAATRRGWGTRTVWWAVVAVVVCVGLAAGYVAWRGRARAAAGPQIRSLAVLPLRNLSGDASQDYLAEGITEELIGKLAGIRELKVTSHTSVMRFKDPKISVPEIAQALGVDAVVEGSVIREGDRIRVSAQLIRAATDTHLWSESYDREMSDALTLESELAQAIAEKVRVSVTGAEQERLTAARAVAPEVYESYLRGRYVAEHGFGSVELEQAVKNFDDAIAKDPTFAQAYLGLAVTYFEMGKVYAGGDPREMDPKAMQAARKAIELDPNLTNAHVLLANALQKEWQWAASEAEYKRALQLGPNDATAHLGYAFWLLSQGRTDEALEWERRARELDPELVSGSDIAWILFQSHRFDEAIREAREAVAVQPDDVSGLYFLGFALLGKGEAAEAIPVLEKSVALSKGSPVPEGILVRAYAQAGRREDALRLLAKMKRRREEGYFPAAALLNAYLGLGDKEQAFVWLEEAVRERSDIVQFIKTHPFFDPIRSDPRFVDLQRRMGLG
ncbi:MAG TPA: tetratricopeptide repeat protein [Edaphobacter sp.]|nr:tetratricopeptide repeat protein [Edaphobacter sp.]